jgi:fatty-acyl-CoA synthase
VTALVAEQAAARPDAPAVIYQERVIGFAELDDMGRRAATGLAELGVGAGDRVALWLPNAPAYLALWLGCARLGAIAVAVNTRFRSAEVGDIVGRSGAKVLAMWPGFRDIDFLAILAEVDAAALEGLETLILYDEDGAEHPAPAQVGHCRRVAFPDLMERPPEAADRATAQAGVNIFTTSGTTSKPKFVLHNQGGVARHARIVARAFGYAEAGAPLLQFLPFCGVYGFNMSTASIAAGIPMVLMTAFDVDEALSLIRRHGVQHMNGSDDVIHAMLEASPDDVALPTIRYMGYANFNASLADIIERADARGLTLVGLYGMSEVQALFARQSPTAPIPERRLGGGRLVSDQARVRVRDPDSGALLAHGQQGELELSGPSLMSGYFENPEATAETITEDGFVRTGDLGYTTAENHFVYVSRMGDVLRLGGFLVSPAEIESHLLDHASVADVQVVGASTPNGIRPVGFVTLRPGQPFDEAALIQHCVSGLAKFKAPLRIIPVEAFPTTQSANGTKIQRGKLREMAEQGLAEAAPRLAGD